METASVINKIIVDKFNHFSKRLFERYGISISIDEYIFLSGLWLRKSKKSTNSKQLIGVLTIKGIEVKVVKSLLPPSVLLTALPIKKKDDKKKLAAFERHRAKNNGFVVSYAFVDECRES